MPQVEVKFYASLKEKLGKDVVSLKAENVKEAIELLKDKLGENFSRWVLEKDGSLKNYYILIVNERIVDKKNLINTKLKDKDILHIFPPIAGG